MKKIEFSKFLILLTFIVFILTLKYSITRDFSSVMDVTVFVTSISITGSILGTGIIWYLKKSQAEHVASMEAYMYKGVMDTRLHYNEEMLKLKQKYNVTDDDLSEIESESPMDEISESVMNNMQSKMDSQMDEATSCTDFQILG